MNLEPDTPATAPPATAHPADPPAGAIGRMAAEMLDVLAEHLHEQPADTSLPELLACSAEGAADAHGLAPDAWIRDGVETAALLGLAITALPLPRGQLRRGSLAARFAAMTARQQRIWIINAADVLHYSNHPDAYGPPLGEILAREAPQAEHPAVTPRAVEHPAPSAHIDHRHGQGVYLQFLPACVAPASCDRDAQPNFALPYEGEPVVIARGHVMWLAADPGATLIATETTQLWGAPMIAEGCGAARWDPDSLVPLDPSYIGLEDGDAEAIQTAWTLLIDRADEFLDLADQAPTQAGP
jgi:hypothetical protein